LFLPHLQLLLAAILAARCFGSGSSRRTLALACDEAMESTPGLKNNRYSYRSTTDNSHNNNNNNNEDYNYKWELGDVDPNVDVDGIADSNEDDNNDNYNYNKAPAKWQQQQKLYGNRKRVQHIIAKGRPNYFHLGHSFFGQTT